jgi:hypothetical protein
MKARQKPQRPAALEAAGGRGFNFEDYVAAEFLGAMFVGGHPLGANLGDITKIAWQTGGDLGWRLDDLLITSSGPTGLCQAAVSCRSGKEVTASGFKQDFVEAAWSHWLNTDEPVFNRDQDLLCLMAGEVADSTLGSWHELLRTATSVSEERGLTRLNQRCRRILESLRCPDGLATGVDSSQVWQLAARVRLLRRDFFHEPSESLRNGLSEARRAIKSGAPEDAKNLWERLVRMAAELREKGGEITRPQLIERLRDEVDLTDHPQFGADLATLDRRSEEAVSDVRASIGTTGIAVSRTDLKAKVIKTIASHRVVVLVGESGCGKSALIRAVAAESKHRVVWIVPEMLEQDSLADFEARLRLKNPLAAIVSNSVVPCLVVVDGVEHCARNGPAVLRKLVSTLVRECPRQQVTIVLTCQVESWASLASNFVEAGFDAEVLSVIDVPLLSATEATEVIKEVPVLNHPTTRAALGRMLRNLKFLDWVVTAATRHGGSGLESCIGVTPIIDWVWQKWVGDDSGRYARAGLLQRVARLESQGLIAGINTGNLSSDELARLAELEEYDLLRVRQERIRFSHDLLGDWARLRILIGEDPSSDAAKQRTYAAPQWHRAVRLYGQWLLEVGGGVARWQAALDRCDPSSVEGKVIRDLLLEAVLATAADESLWEQAWTTLVARDGEYLKRLLDRALLVATIPNPRVFAIQDRAMAERLAVRMRWPRWEYFGPMLRVLRRHQDEVVRFAREEAAKVCALWLQTIPWQWDDGTPFPWRQQAAELAVSIVREVQCQLAEDKWLRDEEGQAEFAALFAAAPDLPDEVAQVALELAKRRDDPASVVARADAYRKQQEQLSRPRRRKSGPRRSRFMTDVLHLGEIRDPWPDGPRSRVPEVFRTACLEPSALLPLLHVRPSAAAELLLAVCLKPPKPDDPGGYFDSISPLRDDVEVAKWRQGHPAMYFRGPFLLFLQTNPDVGVDVIVRLINFATARHCEREARFRLREGEGEIDVMGPVRMLTEDGVQELLGDQRCFGWYREHFISSNVVVSALMALEKWLYDLADANLDSARTQIRRILRHSRSIPIAGVLLAVGKRHSTLFQDVLQPLLSIWQLYAWDQQLVLHGDTWRIGLTSWVPYGEQTFNQVRDWHTMPHRSNQLLDYAVRLFLFHEPTRQYFATARMLWQELAVGPAAESLGLLIERFKVENYRAEQIDDEHVQFRHEWPERMREQTRAAVASSDATMSILMFPRQCRERLNNMQPLSDSERDACGQKLREFTNYEIADDESTAHRRRADAICGGIAVLMILHPDWFKTQPELEEWCLGQLTQIIEDPAPRNPIECRETITDSHWEGFLGEICVTELAENPSSVGLRELVGQSVTGFFFTTAAVTLRRAFQLRERLGAEFERLLNVALFWAGWCHVRDFAEKWQIQHGYLQRSAYRLLRAYIEGRVPSVPLRWSVVGRFAVRRRKRLHRVRFPAESHSPRSSPKGRRQTVPLRDPGFDIEFLRYAFEWLPALDASWTERDRRRYRRLVRGLLSVSLRMLPRLAPNQDVGGTPFRFDGWVFDLTARTIVRLRDDELPRQMWEPILALGPRYHFWIGSFLGAWMLGGVQAASSPVDFVRRWSEMLTFALSHPLWKSDWHLDELVCELLGTNCGRTSIGENEQFAPLLESMAPLFEAASRLWFSRPRVVQHFAAFLSCPAAGGLVCSGIGWLWNAVRALGEHAWDCERLESDLVGALQTAWRGHPDQIRRDDTLRSAFLGLLNVLASRQNHAAIDLRDRVLSAGG